MLYDVVLKPSNRVVVSSREEAFCAGFVREFNSGFRIPRVRAKMVRVDSVARSPRLK